MMRAETPLPEALLAARALACERDGRMLFDGLELELDAGAIVELTGANGSGKTTLLRILAGLASGYSGTIERKARRPGWLHYLGHRAALSAALSPRENLRWYTRLVGDERDHTLGDRALARVGLGGYEDVPCHRLSAGQQRRAALARLATGDAIVWLLDEPLTALDAEGAALVRSLLLEHRARGGAALCATHQPLGIENVATVALGSQT